MKETNMKLAFLGLGVMGFPMAGHLKAKGHEVTVYNRTASKAEAWVKQHGGAFSADIAGAVRDAEIVLMCVGNDRDLFDVANAALLGMKPGALLVDHTTASADAARSLNEAAAAKGVSFIDAPVSGGQAGAEKGQLTVMCGGDAAAFDKARPVIDCYAKACTLMGASGAGQLTKMVNQICIAGLVQALSEALAFADKAGLDGNVVLDVISKGAAQSWQMENRGRTMLKREFNFGFAVDWMRKDLSICLDEARRNGARLPVTAMVDQFYGDVQKAGGNRFDTSSLIARLD
jgi:3-hydroxyisobutyrate dehydrogenase-like beta-hydroxyacid dehydrogenase